MLTLARAHYYLELSQELGLPLVVDPARSRYFNCLLEHVAHSLHTGAADRVVAYFDRKVVARSRESYPELFQANLSIPPITEHLVQRARVNKCSLLDATLDLRNSKHARRFREWCSRVQAAQVTGRSGLRELQRLLKGLEDVCEKWCKDVDDEVRHKRRIISLSRLWIVGGLLGALDLHEFKIRDPVLIGSKKISYFLLLNDLLREPH